MLGNVSKNFRNMCFEIYELDPAHFPSVPEFAWQVALKKTKVKFERLTDFDMLLMVENSVTGGICLAIY